MVVITRCDCTLLKVGPAACIFSSLMTSLLPIPKLFEAPPAGAPGRWSCDLTLSSLISERLPAPTRLILPEPPPATACVSCTGSSVRSEPLASLWPEPTRITFVEDVLTWLVAWFCYYCFTMADEPEMLPLFC